jgi:uncharacterized protein (TIGR04255 family)
MLFPDFQRVIYRKNPLIEVIFQARIPKFLPIESELPSEFQKTVVKEYPIYEQRSVIQFVIAASSQENRIPSDIPGRMHAFISADKFWTIVVSGDGLTLSTRKYERWEEFIDRLRSALDAFLRVYPLPIFTRIGLRYQNVISRESLGLDNKGWKELLRPPIAGEFMEDGLNESDVLARQAVLTIRVQNEDMLLLRHGLVTHKDKQTLAYLIDSDFYNEEQRTTDSHGTLDVAKRLHAHSGRLFRWCITDLLHAAMDPTPIPD